MKDNTNFEEVLLDLLSSKYDRKPTKNENYAIQLINVHQEFVERNIKLTSLLNNYIDSIEKRSKTNRFFKKFIFWLFVSFLLALTVVVVVVFIKVDMNKVNVASVVSLISVAVTYLGSLLAIFEIMSKYLFSATEEKDTIEMIKAVFDNDVKVEDLMSKAIKENKDENFEKLSKSKELLDKGIITQEEFDKLKDKFVNNLL